MRRASLLLAACATAGCLTAGTAWSNYDHPKSAKRHSVELVTAFNQCTDGNLVHRPSLALPSCTPVPTTANNPANRLSWSWSGAMEIAFKTTTGNFSIKIRSRSIFNNGNPFTGNLTATVPLRITDNGCGVGSSSYDVDCTRQDFLLPIGITCFNSFCYAPTPSANAVLPGTVEPYEESNIEIDQIELTDPDGDAFARGGLFVR